MFCMSHVLHFIDAGSANCDAGDIGAQTAHVVGCTDGVDTVLCNRIAGLRGIGQILAVLEDDVAANLTVSLP